MVQGLVALEPTIIRRFGCIYMPRLIEQNKHDSFENHMITTLKASALTFFRQHETALSKHPEQVPHTQSS